MSEFMAWVSHGIKRGKPGMRPRMAVYVASLVVGLTVVLALYLMLVGRTAARGRHIQHLQDEWFQLVRENEQLELELSRESSVSHVRERAVALGFRAAEQIEFLQP